MNDDRGCIQYEGQIEATSCQFLLQLGKVYQEQKSGSRGVQCDKLFPVGAVVCKAELPHIQSVWRGVKATLQPPTPSQMKYWDDWNVNIYPFLNFGSPILVKLHKHNPFYSPHLEVMANFVLVGCQDSILVCPLQDM